MKLTLFLFPYLHIVPLLVISNHDSVFGFSHDFNEATLLLLTDLTKLKIL